MNAVCTCGVSPAELQVDLGEVQGCSPACPLGLGSLSPSLLSEG